LFGLGATYQINDALSVFGGIHEGHSPAPNDGKSDPEEALNTEIGTRFVTQNLYTEVTGFYSDYSNLLGACTNSTGSNCTIGDASNGGKATIQGLEVLSNYTQVLTAALNLPVGLTYTYTDGTFDSSFADAGVWGTVTKGDRMPSLSEHQLQLRAGLAHASGWGVDMNINYFSDTCSTAACGVNEGIDAYTVVDLAGRFQATKQLGFYASVDNIFNSEDVVARAPKNGARAQKPLSALVGVNFNF
jgi:Fe(3+) dicitrate transport protein